MAKKPTASAKSKKTEKPQDPVLSAVLDKFKSSWDYTSGSWHDRWDNNYNLYHNNRIKRGYDGITDIFVPMTFSTIETLNSALFGTKPKFDYIPPHEKKDQKTDILNALLDFYWDKDQWSLKVINTGWSMLSLGTGIDYFAWDGDCPRMINVPLRDFFIDPMATCLDDARFMGRRYLTTLENLKSFEVVDPETGDMKPKYKNLAKIPKSAAGPIEENTDKQEKDMFYGSTVTDADKSQVEVIELWDMVEDRIYSVANRSTIIENEENYFKAKARANGVKYPKALAPFADARDYVDASLFFAKGEIDFIADLQELLNDTTNQNNDAIIYALNQMYTLDPKFADKINEIENIPGAVFPFPADAFQPVRQGQIPNDAFNERLNIKNEIRETTASNETVKGVGSDTNATATEIQAQIAGAGQRLGLKVTRIENGYFHRVARIVLEMVKLYVTEPMMVRIMGKDGARWEEFDPKEFDGDYEPRVQLDITVENDKQQRANEAKELMAAFLNDPDVNQRELKKLALQRGFDLEPDEVDMLLVEEVPVMPEQSPELPSALPPALPEVPPMGMPTDGLMPPMVPEDDMELPPELIEALLNDPTLAGVPA